MSASVLTENIPAHVPQELVLPYPLGARKVVYENPYETLVANVQKGPDIFYAADVYPVNKGGWVIRRAEDLRAVYDDNVHFTKKGFSGFAALLNEEWDVIPTELEPPVHTDFRRVLNKLFTPKAMAELDGKVRTRARELINTFKNNGECDFINDFAVPFPVLIILELLGLPAEKMDLFLKWENQMLHSGNTEERIAGTRATKEYLLEVIEEKRRNPGNDLITNTINLKVAGRSLTPIEIFGHCFNLFVGGLDTVGSNLGWHFYHMASHQDFQAQIRNDTALIKPGIEELLRAYAAVTTFRICIKETKIHGVTIMPGDRVAMSTALAARDPEAYPNPNEIRLDRKPRHLTFGAGIHSCLGLHLARRELSVAMDEMFKAVPTFRLKPDAPIPFFVGGIHHLQALPLVW